MVDQDVCKFYNAAHAVYASYGGVVLGSAAQEAEAIASALGSEGKAAILANHGLLTVGQTVDEAGYLFGLLDRSCQIQIDLLKMGVRPVEIDHREAEFNFRVESRADSLYWEFQPEYDFEVDAAKAEFEDLSLDELELHLEL
jgi:ribulose-5-phosphate 4-epimerase/fuculose-1-phosphate aldolase